MLQKNISIKFQELNFQKMSLISDAQDYVDNSEDLSEEHKTHLNTLLDRGIVVPDAIKGRRPDALRRIVSRNPLPVPGIIYRWTMHFNILTCCDFIRMRFSLFSI
jgi:hypothetical protein